MSASHGPPATQGTTAEDADDRRRAAQSIDESLVVEAGAGTGKTTLLVTRIVNLLRRAVVDGSSRPVRMSEIVAITFTEKAAGELKARLRDVLEQAVSTGWLHDEKLSDSERALLSDAVGELDRAVVATIHSFCANLIRERPVEAGIDPGRRTADALTQSILFDEAWQRWREQAYEKADDAALLGALRLELKADRSGPDDRSASIRDLAETLVHNRDLLDFLPQPIDEERAWEFIRTQINECASALSACLKHTKVANKPSDRAGRIAETFLKDWHPIRAAAAPEARTVVVHSIDIPSNLGGDVRRWSDPAQLGRLRETLEKLRDELLPDAAAALTHNLLVHLVSRLKEFVAFYDQLKTDRELLDFQDLLLIARNMLRDNAETSAYFRDRYRFLLIDEFQDTDPLQAEVALLLSASPAPTANMDMAGRSVEDRAVDPGRLFLVGDPKQSIYRFRRADIELYEHCMKLVGSDGHVRVRQNFRSGSRILTWVNRVFGRLIERPADGAYQPEYASLLPGPHAEAWPGRVVLLYPPDPAEDRRGTIDKVRYREGCSIALFIQRAVREGWPCAPDGEGLRLSDIAILLPQTTGLSAYEEAFRACGLSYHITGGRHFYERVEIKSLINVVTAIDNPEDAIALVGAMRSAFFGCSDEDLVRHVLEGGELNYLRPRITPASQVAAVFDLLHRLHRDRNNRSVAALLIDFFDATKGLENFLTKPHGESRVANLFKVVDAARSMEHSGILTFRGFARWLRERQIAREEEADSPQAEPGDESVQVLTVHKSKGLEFPMTVIADLHGGEPRAANRLIFDRTRQRLHLRCGPLRTAGWREAQAWDLKRVEAERRRLFYVAATRARDYLVLPVFWRKLADHGSEDTAATGMHKYLELADDSLPAPSGELPWGESVGDALVFDTRSLSAWPEPEYAPRLDLQEPVHPAVERFLVERTEWERSRDEIFKRAHGARAVRHASDLGAKEVTAPVPPLAEAQETGTGADFGTLVHRLLELNLSDRLREKDLGEAADYLAKDLGLTRQDAINATNIAAQAINCPLLHRIRTARRRFFEVPFSCTDGDAILDGRIDVVAEEEDGLLLVDFKTDRVQAGREATLAQIYIPQMRAYIAAAQATTGRPVRSAQLLFLRTLATVEVADLQLHRDERDGGGTVSAAPC